MFWERKVATGAVLGPTCNALRRLRAAFVLAGLVVMVALSGGCGRSQSAAIETNDDYQVRLSTLPGIPEQGDGMVIVNVRDKNGNMVPGAKVAIEANMSHAGMVPVNAEAAPNNATGTYNVRLTWTMSGAWYVDVKIELAGGEVIRRRFPVDVK